MFKPKIYFIVALIISLLSQQAVAQEVAPLEKVQLNLKETLEFALENNVDAKNARLEILISKGVVGENRAAGLPQINSTLEMTKNVQPPLLILPAEAGGIIPDDGSGGGGSPDTPDDITVIPFAVNYQSSLSINVEQMIFNGSYFVGLKAAKTLKTLTEFDKIKTENDVLENVKKAYFTVLVNDERRKLVEANLTRTNALLRETEAMYEAGFVEKLDVSRIKVQSNNLKTELEKNEVAVAVSKELLKLNMGLPESIEIELTQDLSSLSNEAEILKMLSQSNTNRVEVDQVITNRDLAKLDLKNNQIQYMPQISAFGTFQRVSGAENMGSIFQSDRWFSSSFVGLRMSIPIFDGLNKSFRIQQSRLKVNQLENQLFFMEQNVALELFQARKMLQNSLRTLVVQEENMELAREVFEMTKIKYNEGVGSNLEVVEANSTLEEAESNYFSALYDALIAKVDLEKALGILQEGLID
ncbi:outer membrane protein TolC [Algoriphagus sp. 4150]|uniref:TolC family protein n=1 Tax=Algoriphagus sp. 4150 TaxID=2817756 RepID=UPI00285F8400|nr:TolC family protein [Algoriphagus sp. 4150]MDR7131285.1 outer membrane protein TolC [Algoriphagus sp. 4150]